VATDTCLSISGSATNRGVGPRSTYCDLATLPEWPELPYREWCLISMRKRWRIVFPVVGLALFSAVSYHSFRRDREIQRIPSKYFWWSAIRLDSDPMNKGNRGTKPCGSAKENCVSWDLIWVDPGYLEELLMLSALPAFVVGGFAVSALGRLGISQVSSFMCLMPVLIVAWYYFSGWLLERWTRKWSQSSAPRPSMRRPVDVKAHFTFFFLLSVSLFPFS
jgi:hypothetical protein